MCSYFSINSNEMPHVKSKGFAILKCGKLLLGRLQPSQKELGNRSIKFYEGKRSYKRELKEVAENLKLEKKSSNTIGDVLKRLFLVHERVFYLDDELTIQTHKVVPRRVFFFFILMNSFQFILFPVNRTAPVLRFKNLIFVVVFVVPTLNKKIKRDLRGIFFPRFLLASLRSTSLTVPTNIISSLFFIFVFVFIIICLI